MGRALIDSPDSPSLFPANLGNFKNGPSFSHTAGARYH